eukprot:gene4579-20845_t
MASLSQSPNRSYFGRRSRRPLGIVERKTSNGLDDVSGYFPDSDEENASSSMEENKDESPELITSADKSKDFINQSMQHDDTREAVTELFTEERRNEDSDVNMQTVLEDLPVLEKKFENIPQPVHETPIRTPTANLSYGEAFVGLSNLKMSANSSRQNRKQTTASTSTEAVLNQSTNNEERVDENSMNVPTVTKSKRDIGVETILDSEVKSDSDAHRTRDVGVGTSWLQKSKSRRKASKKDDDNTYYEHGEADDVYKRVTARGHRKLRNKQERFYLGSGALSSSDDYEEEKTRPKRIPWRGGYSRKKQSESQVDRKQTNVSKKKSNKGSDMNPAQEASTSVKTLQRSYKSSLKSSNFEKPMQDARHPKSQSKSTMKERSKRMVKSRHRDASPDYSNKFVKKPRSRGRALSDDRESDDREMAKSGRFNRLKNEKSLSSRRKESLDKENSLGLATPNFGKETPDMQSRSIKGSQTKSKKKIQRIVFQDKSKKGQKKTPLKNAVSSTGKKKETSKIDEKDKREKVIAREKDNGRKKDKRRGKDDGREDDNGREKKDGGKKDNARKKDNRREKVSGHNMHPTNEVETPKSRTGSSWVGPSPLPMVGQESNSSRHLASLLAGKKKKKKTDDSFVTPQRHDSVNTLPGRASLEPDAPSTRKRNSKKLSSDVGETGGVKSPSSKRRRKTHTISYESSASRTSRKGARSRMSSAKRIATEGEAEQSPITPMRSKENEIVQSTPLAKSPKKAVQQDSSNAKRKKSQGKTPQATIPNIGMEDDTLKRLNIIFTPDMLKLRRPPQSSATKDQDPSTLQNVLVHKFFSSATFSAGVMVLLPDTIKGPHTVEEDTLTKSVTIKMTKSRFTFGSIWKWEKIEEGTIWEVFYIERGDVNVMVKGRCNEVIGPGSTFYVPRENVYAIKNESKTEEARIFFVHVKNLLKSEILRPLTATNNA